jgi:predicted type IV restriction endonuclease
LQEITSLAEKPSESFTRMLLKTAGIQHVRDKTLPDFQELVGAAFREFVNVKILQRLELTKASPSAASTQPDPLAATAEPTKDGERSLPSQTEIEVVAFVKRRLAFLVDDETLFDAVEKIGYNDYKGKFVVYFERERRGRLFDFFEGGIRGPKYRFAFADIPEEVTAAKLVGSVIDAPLLQVFKRRVAGEAAPHPTGTSPTAA